MSEVIESLPTPSEAKESPVSSRAMSPRPLPIFVVGMSRSGTKWLSNLLAAHPEVAAVQSQRHRGILETSIFDATQTKFDLSSDDDFAAFLELWALSDFFRESSARKELFYGLAPNERDYCRLFEILMEDMACRRGARYWLQKTSPDTAVRVLPRYPKARCVLIQRRLLDVLRSQAALNRRNGKSLDVLRTTYDYIYQEKHLTRLKRRGENVAFVTYEELRANPFAKVQELCNELGIRKVEGNLESLFPPNTSFPTERTSLPRHVEFAAKLFALLLRASPLFLMEGFSALKRMIRSHADPSPFVSGEFGALKDRCLQKSVEDRQ